jgi:hypothetical protein
VSTIRSATAVIAAALVASAAACGGGDHRPVTKGATSNAPFRPPSKTTGTATTPKVVSRTFLSTGDAYVSQDEPTSNFGKTAELRIDASPPARAYIRFEPFGVRGKIDTATVRVYALSTSGNGFDLHNTSGKWSESGLSLANAPPAGAPIGFSGPLNAGAWVSVDVSRLVSSTIHSVNVVLTGLGSTALVIASREQRRRAPRLIIAGTP